MYINISKYFMSAFQKYDVLDKDPQIYQYGLMISISYFFSSLVVITIGVSFNMFLNSVLYIFLFDKLREYSGGYHANSYLECCSLFIFFYLLCIFLCTSISYFISLLICSFLLLFSKNYIPTYHPNKKTNDLLTSRAKEISTKRFVISIISSFILYFFIPSISIQINIVIIEILILIRIQFYINQKRRCTNEKSINNYC